MEPLKFEVEELEQRIAPDSTGTNPVPEGATPQPSGNPSQNPVPAGSNPQPSGG